MIFFTFSTTQFIITFRMVIIINNIQTNIELQNICTVIIPNKTTVKYSIQFNMCLVLNYIIKFIFPTNILFINEQI